MCKSCADRTKCIECAATAARSATNAKMFSTRRTAAPSSAGAGRTCAAPAGAGGIIGNQIRDPIDYCIMTAGDDSIGTACGQR
jgi:hypothetical protein